jgi:hypothetical protein
LSQLRLPTFTFFARRARGIPVVDKRHPELTYAIEFSIVLKLRESRRLEFRDSSFPAKKEHA